eukprot:GFKZ01012127.1.p1 GENE.GFKZ01012127.1~~GFKZ01012127.1.p1  ORF type:complete len:574 (+),score=97.67 GFKZ01012127.1:272-1993(+)
MPQSASSLPSFATPLRHLHLHCPRLTLRSSLTPLFPVPHYLKSTPRPSWLSMTLPIPTRGSPRRPTTPSSTLLCVSLTASNLTSLRSQLSAATAAGAQIAELRLDLLEPETDWKSLLPQSPLPLIVTNRAQWEGGNSTLDEPQRLSMLIDAIEAGVSHIDVEMKAADEFWKHLENRGIRLSSTKLILSHHNFDRPLSAEEIRATISSMKSKGADVAKIAMMAKSALDNCTVFRELQKADMPTIVLAMGDLGKPSRILAGKFGAYLTFASVEQGKGSAPGQVDIKSMVDVYRFGEIGRETRLYGVIGNPVMQSMGPVLHNRVYRETGLDAAYVHLLVKGEVGRFMREMSELGFWGLSVTIPWKMDAIEAMDEVEEAVLKIGAMNTVVKGVDGRLKGQNTDWRGALDPVCEKTGGNLRGKRVLILGAGGAGKAMMYGAVERGAEDVVVANRTKERAVQLASGIGGKVTGIGIDEIGEYGSFDVVMNSTSVGMIPNVEECPVNVELLKEGMVVFDAVYNPLETRLLREARERGGVCVSGLDMFVGQAALQFAAWFPEVKIPVEVMREAVLSQLGNQ